MNVLFKEADVFHYYHEIVLHFHRALIFVLRSTQNEIIFKNKM